MLVGSTSESSSFEPSFFRVTERSYSDPMRSVVLCVALISLGCSPKSGKSSGGDGGNLDALGGDAGGSVDAGFNARNIGPAIPDWGAMRSGPGPNATISIFAGTLPRGRDGVGRAAELSGPSGIAVGSDGALFIADTGNCTIRKQTIDGAVITVAGTALSCGSLDGTGAEARFSSPSGLTVDSNGNVFVADIGNHTVRRITPAGLVTTVAGHAGQAGNVNGDATTTARLRYPTAVAIDSSATLYIATLDGIRKVTNTGSVSTLVPLGGAVGASLGVAIDSTNTVYVLESTTFQNNNSTVRKFGADGQPVNWTTGEAALTVPHSVGLAVASDGTVFLASGGGVSQTPNIYYRFSAVVKVSPAGVTEVFSGNINERGNVDGSATNARFQYPAAIAVGPDGVSYVADRDNDEIRRVAADGSVTTVAGSHVIDVVDGPRAEARFSAPSGLSVEKDGTLLVADTGYNAIRAISPSGLVSTRARVKAPVEVASDANGSFWALDGDSSLFAFDSAGVGTQLLPHVDAITSNRAGTLFYSVNHAISAQARGSSSAQLLVPDSKTVTLSTAPNGTLYAHEGYRLSFFNEANEAQEILSTVSANARFPLTVDPEGNVYFATYENLIRKVTPSKEVSIVAGVLYPTDYTGVQPGPALAPIGRVKGLVWFDGALFATVDSLVVRISSEH